MVWEVWGDSRLFSQSRGVPGGQVCGGKELARVPGGQVYGGRKLGGVHGGQVHGGKKLARARLRQIFSCLFVFSTAFAVLLLPVVCGESWAAFQGIAVDSKTAAMGDCWSSSDYGFHFLAPVPPGSVNLSASICYSAPYGLPELEQKTVLLNLPWRTKMTTLGILERGGGLYKERILSASLSHQAFPSTRIVLSLGMFSMSVAGLGQTKFLVLGAGLRSRPVRSLEACIGLGNLTSSSASDPYRGTVPSTFLFGVSLKPRENVTAAGEIRKTPGTESSVHAGVEFELQKGIRMRCGLQTVPVELAMGFAIDLGRLSIESASSFHSVLGRTDIITLTFRGSDGASKSRNPPKSNSRSEADKPASKTVSSARFEANDRPKEGAW